MKIIARMKAEHWGCYSARFEFVIYGVHVTLVTNFEGSPYAYVHKAKENTGLIVRHSIELSNYAEDGMECLRENRPQITEWLYELFWPESDLW